MFNTRIQQPGETIDQYVTDLRNKSKTCEFGDLTERLIKDRVVCGVASDKTRSRLLKHADLTLATALDICRADEATASQMKSMSSAAACAVTPTDEAEVILLRMKRNKPPKPGKQQECGYCGGTRRPYQKCPAHGAECLKCGQQNNFGRICQSGSRRTEHREVNELDYESYSEDDMLLGAKRIGPPQSLSTLRTFV